MKQALKVKRIVEKRNKAQGSSAKFTIYDPVNIGGFGL
jgi:hypothetical protein